MWPFFRSKNKSRNSQKSTSFQRSPLQKPGLRHLALEPLERRELLTVLYWDTNGATPGLGGNGTWNATSACWSTSAAGNIATQAWAAGSDAVFSGNSADVVNIGAAVNASSVQLNAGTLKMDAAGSLNNTSMLNVNGGVFDLNGNSMTVGGLLSNGSTAGVVANNLASTAATLTVAGKNDRSDFYAGSLKNYSGASGGILGLSVSLQTTTTGGYSLFLQNATNTYSGQTSISADSYYASLANQTANSLSPNSSINVGARATLLLDYQNATIAGLEGSGGIVANAWGSTASLATLTINNSSNKTYAGTLLDSDSTKLAVVKTGAGTQTFSGNNSIRGGTTISQGTLQAGSITALSASSVLTVNGGVFDLNGNNVTVKGLIGSTAAGTVANNLSGTNANLTVAGGDRTTDFYYGELKNSTSGSGGTLGLTVTVKSPTTGGYSLVLSNDDNTYSGTTSIFAGGPYNASLINGVTDAFSPNSSVNVGSYGQLILNTFNAKIAGLEGAGTVFNWYSGSGTATLTINSNSAKTFSGIIRDGTAPTKLALVKTGTGRLTLTGTNTYTGGTTISQGTVWLGDTTTNGSVSGNIVNNSLLVFLNATEQTYSGNISGSGEVGFDNLAPLTLSGNSTHTGPTNIYGLVNLTGALTNSTVTVQQGGVYGSGTIVSSVRITDYSGIMGNIDYTPGRLNTGNLTFDSQSMFGPIIDGNTAGSGYDQVQVTGSVNIAASVSFYPVRARNTSPGDVLTLIKNDGADAVVGTFAGQSEWSTFSSGGFNFHITYLYNAEAQTFGDGNDVALVAY